MTPTELLAQVFAAFDAQDISTLAAFITGDVELRLGNAPLIRGKSGFVDATPVYATA